jgi:hypothetical protein
MNAFGIVIAWLTSVVAATLLHRWTELPAGSTRAGSALATKA